MMKTKVTKYMLDLLVTENTPLNKNYFLLKLTTTNKSILPKMHPGQFAELRVNNSVFLRRPLSINYVDTNKNELWLLVQKVGDGTKAISKYAKGDIINLLLPLGNSFTTSNLSTENNILLIGGGVGIAPILFLASNLDKKGLKAKVLIGARSKKDLLELEYLEKYAELYCTTEDGSFGEQGYLTQHSILSTENFTHIFTCGPRPMMQAVAKYANQNNINCEVSLENTMACGFGVCLCCVEKTKKGNLCVCTDGPVFNINELRWTN